MMNTSPLLAPTVFATERRSVDPVAQLARQFDEVCRRAHEPGQIAAALEAAGYSDRTVQIELGEPSTFAVAERLFAMVPKRRRSVHRSLSQSHPHVIMVVRAFLLTLPGVMTILVVPSFGTRSSAMLMVVSLVYGWSLNQVVAYLGYRTLYEYGQSTAAHLMRLSVAWACLPWCVVLLGFGLLGQTNRVALWVSTGQVLYFLAAAMLRVLDRERILLLSLVPAVIAGPLAMLGLIIAAEFALGFALAICFVLTVVSGGSERKVKLIDQMAKHQSELTVQAAHGALCAFIVGVSAVMLQISGVHTSGPSPDLAVLPIILAMTLSESQLVKFRYRVVGHMRQNIGLREFRVRVQRELVASARRYVVVGAALALVTAVLLQLLGRMNAIDAIRLIAFTALGGAFFVDIALVAHDYARFTLVPLLMTSIMSLGLAVILGLTSAGSLLVYEGFCVACVALLLAMVATARAVLPDILNYR